MATQDSHGTDGYLNDPEVMRRWVDSIKAWIVKNTYDNRMLAERKTFPELGLAKGRGTTTNNHKMQVPVPESHRILLPSNTSLPDSTTPSNRSPYPWATQKIIFPSTTLIPKSGIPPSNKSLPFPFPRYGHAVATSARGELLLFGGLVKDVVRNDLYSFDARNLSVSLLKTTAETPSPRVGHASVLLNSVLVVWGGDTKARASDTLDDGLYLLNLRE